MSELPHFEMLCQNYPPGSNPQLVDVEETIAFCEYNKDALNDPQQLERLKARRQKIIDLIAEEEDRKHQRKNRPHRSAGGHS